MNFAFKTRTSVSKTRNSEFKMMNFAGPRRDGASSCEQSPPQLGLSRDLCDRMRVITQPCDGTADPWRIVVAGVTECLQCDGQLDVACSMDTESAGCCGASGGHTLCHPKLADGTCGADGFGDSNEDATTIVGRFMAVGTQMSYPEALAYCTTNYAGLASIHSPTEQDHASAACRAYADGSGDTGKVAGCWIGFTDEATRGGFAWTDSSAADYVNWDPGEPNGFNGATEENHVAMVFFSEYSWNGHWNDVDGSVEIAQYCANPAGFDPPNDPDTQAFCDAPWNPFGGYFPLCQVQAAPAPSVGAQMVWGTGTTSSFRIRTYTSNPHHKLASRVMF